MCDAHVCSQDVKAQKINEALARLMKSSGPVEPFRGYPWIVFSLGKTQYAMNAKSVLRVAILYEIIPFENVPEYCRGIVWDRDGPIRLLDLRTLFDGQTEAENEKDDFPVAIVTECKEKRIGMIVDEVIALGYYDDYIERPAEKSDGKLGYICGMIVDQRFEVPVPVLSHERIGALVFEHEQAKINWNGRIDLRILKKRGTESPE